MLYMAGDIALAFIAVIIGLAYDSPGLVALAVYSLADTMSLGRPRKPGLGDDYASLAVVAFLVWAGYSLIAGASELPTQSFRPAFLVIVFAVAWLGYKLVLLKKSENWHLSHTEGDVLSLVALLLVYVLSWVPGLEVALTICFGVMVLYEAGEMAFEALCQIMRNF